MVCDWWVFRVLCDLVTLFVIVGGTQVYPTWVATVVVWVALYITRFILAPKVEIPENYEYHTYCSPISTPPPSPSLVAYWAVAS